MEYSIVNSDRSIFYGDMVLFENNVRLREEAIKVVVGRNTDCQVVQTSTSLWISNHKFMHGQCQRRAVAKYLKSILCGAYWIFLSHNKFILGRNVKFKIVRKNEYLSKNTEIILL